ncbi:MAG: hypothetical protein WAO20_20810, partial [Acidobacteriota bacterium]
MGRFRSSPREKPRLFREAAMYGRFAGGMIRFLRHPITLDEAVETIRTRRQTREQSFLNLLERGVFDWP